MNTPENAVQRQRIAFYFALANFLWLAAWVGTQAYLELTGDIFNRRMFVLHPNVTGTLPVAALCWIIAAIVSGNSMWESKRVTWYGAATLVMLAVPATPLAIVVANGFWKFLSSN